MNDYYRSLNYRVGSTPHGETDTKYWAERLLTQGALRNLEPDQKTGTMAIGDKATIVAEDGRGAWVEAWIYVER